MQLLRRLVASTCAMAMLMSAGSVQAQRRSTTATEALPEASAFQVPPYAGAYQPQGTDERGLWMMADEDERKLRDSQIVIRDPALNAYVREILCRTVGEDRCGSARIYIMRVPDFNASMSPNGTMRVYSGLLLRARNEAELASVLGHEFAHFEMRHTLDGFRRARTGSDILAWTTLLGTAASMYGGVRTGYIDSSFSIFGALSHYQREDERASDILGLSYVARAGYRPLAAADVWDNMMSETDARRVARGQRSIRYDGVAFFASHPTNLQRATYLRNMATLLPAAQFDGRDRYQEVMGPWIREFLSDQIKLNDFGTTEYILGRLAETGWTGPLLFARGELYRTRGNPRDLVQAAEFYSAALNTDPTQIEAYRGLGLSLLRTGSVAEGRAAISSYLQAKPDASDAAMLRALVQG